MADDEIEPAEAIRILARVAIPGPSEIAERFTSKAWRWYEWKKPKEYDAVVRSEKLFFERRASVPASGVFNGQGQRSDIPASEFSRGYLDIWKRELDCSITGSPKRVWRDVLVSRQSVEALNGEGAKGKGGRPTAADWLAIEDSLRLEIKRRGGKRGMRAGLPDRENPRGWRTQADVCTWVAEDILPFRTEHADDSTIKKHVRGMLKRIGAERGET